MVAETCCPYRLFSVAPEAAVIGTVGVQAQSKSAKVSSLPSSPKEPYLTSASFFLMGPLTPKVEEKRAAITASLVNLFICIII